MKTRIALFASGSGTNVQRIATYFKDHEFIEVAGVYCNKPDAYVVFRAAQLGLPCHVFSREEFNGGEVMAQLVADHVDWVILAGFLWLVPDNIIEAFPDRIINIHPALLPKFGGKGMYGAKVHEAVIKAGEKESGISIHLVNEHYDEGAVLFQAKTNITKDDTPETLAAKIHELEYEHYPLIIEETVLE